MSAHTPSHTKFHPPCLPTHRHTPSSIHHVCPTPSHTKFHPPCLPHTVTHQVPSTMSAHTSSHTKFHPPCLPTHRHTPSSIHHVCPHTVTHQVPSTMSAHTPSHTKFHPPCLPTHRHTPSSIHHVCPTPSHTKFHPPCLPTHRHTPSSIHHVCPHTVTHQVPSTMPAHTPSHTKFHPPCLPTHRHTPDRSMPGYTPPRTTAREDPTLTPAQQAYSTAGLQHREPEGCQPPQGRPLTQGAAPGSASLGQNQLTGRIHSLHTPAAAVRQQLARQRLQTATVGCLVAGVFNVPATCLCIYLRHTGLLRQLDVLPH